MADVALVVISVRGEAEQIVAPDVAVLHCQIRAVAGTKHSRQNSGTHTDS